MTGSFERRKYAGRLLTGVSSHDQKTILQQFRDSAATREYTAPFKCARGEHWTERRRQTN